MKGHRYAVLKNDIHTWNRKNHVWDTIPKGTGGRIIDQMLVPLSITYKIIFYEGLHDYLERHKIEGIVFWKDGEPQCKIKRSDFGFKWPV